MAWLSSWLAVPVVAYCIWRLKRAWQRYGREEPIAGGNLPFIGVGAQLARQGPQLFSRLRKELGNVFTVYMGGFDFTFVHDDEFTEKFFTQSNAHFDFDAAPDVLGVGDFLGPSTSETRTVMYKLVARILPRMGNSLPDMLEELHAKFAELPPASFDVYFDLRKISFAVAMRALFGTLYADYPTLNGLVWDFFAASERIAIRPWFMKFGPRRECAKLRKQVLAIMQPIMDSRRAALLRGETPTPNYKELDSMIIAKKSDGQLLTNEELLFLFLGLFIGSTLNMPAVLSLTLLSILQRPALLAQVKAEVKQVVESDGWTEEAFQNMRLLTATVDETMRVFAGPFKIRLNQKVQGVTIPGGSIVTVSPFAQHRREDYYDKPLVFDPNRFIKEGEYTNKDITTYNGHKFAYLPWGAGRHFCQGQKLATFVICNMLAYLVLNFEMEAEPAVMQVDLNSLADPFQALRVKRASLGFTIPMDRKVRYSQSSSKPKI